ncbi:MAG: ornithine cyclodeaminase [Chloroflexi bacterium]|nr:MAG: ornithine cyclodeaminase [Chloroflexota bacterium]
MLALGAQDIRALVPMRDAIEMMKQVFALYSDGKTITPLRVPIGMPDGSGTVLFMPAYVPAGESSASAVGAKIVSVFAGNPAIGLPTINALVVVVDPATGVPLGVLEGATITALRTGAVSGAATDLLARPDASTLAIIGAGVQGVTQAAAVCAVRDIAEIRVADINPQSVATFAERLSVWAPAMSTRVRGVPSAQAAVDGADVICTATTATSAVFDDAWVADGTHINAVGAYTPEMQEIPDATLARAAIVVDAVEAAMHEAGDLIQAIARGALSPERVRVELGHVVTGAAPGRQDAAQVTFFKSVGNAIQDMIVAGAAVERAQARGIGQTLALT